MNAAASPLSNSRPDILLLVGVGDRGTVAPFAIGLVIALLVHGALASTTRLVEPKVESTPIEMAIYKAPPPPPPAPEPPPPPPPEPEPEKKPPPPPPKELPPPPKEPPPPPPPSNSEPPEPQLEEVPVVTGLSLESTVKADSSVVARVGNTTHGDPNQEKFVDPKDVKPYAGGQPGFKAARASTLTQEAKLIKDFKGRYPPDLADQGIEGAVVLLVEISKTGAIGKVSIARSCGHKVLDRLAQQYLKRFRFAPAEVNGEAVDSVLRYTYRFELFD